jgi:hypothetical protein
MKTKIYGWAFVGAISFFTAISCFATGVESSGGTVSQVYGNAWFISESFGKKIKTCYVVSDDFGTAPAKIEAAIVQASNTWGKYLVAKIIEWDGRPTIGSTPEQPNYIDWDISLMSACDGSEDLKIYFGVKDAQVQKALLQYNLPYAFSQPTGDSSQLWGKGFIYVATPQEVSAPSWDTGNHLVGVLLHELGHVLGNGHLDSTIMDADLADALQDTDPTDTLDQIDQTREVVSCFTCGQTYTGVVDLGGWYNASEALQKLTGKSVEISAVKFVKKDKLVGSFSNTLPEGDLIFSNATSSYHFYLKSEQILASSSVDVPLFSTPGGGLYSVGFTYSGVLTADDGTSFPVAVNLNSDDEAFDIVKVDAQGSEGAMWPDRLFVTSYVNWP